MAVGMLDLSNFLHFVGLAFGLGGATIATIISVKAEKDKEIAGAVMKLMPPISKLIFIGLVLLIISGIALPFYISWPLNKGMLIVKHVLVVWIVIFGVLIGTSSRRIRKLVLAQGARQKPSSQFLKIKKRMKAFSIINLILWYLVTLLSVFV